MRLIDEGKISGKQGKDVLVEMFKSGKPAQTIIEEQGLVQVSDTGEIDALIDSVIAANPDQLASYRAGKEALFGFFVGQVIKASKGKANPKSLTNDCGQSCKVDSARSYDFSGLPKREIVKGRPIKWIAMDLTNKTAIVTGGTKGIGRAIAKRSSVRASRSRSRRNEDDIAKQSRN